MTRTRSAYDASGAAWSARPAGVYRRLATALLDTVPGTWSGRRVLDVGAGTAVAADEARARGAARVVASDSAAGMLAHRGPGIPAVLADAGALPFPDRSFDLVVMAFVLGHLEDPVAALAESRRVAPTVAASGFAASWDHPAKAVVDAVMAEDGFVVPDWYRTMKAGEDQVADPDGLAGLAAAAGFSEVSVRLVEVDAGLEGPEDVVAWRWGMAHLAPYVARLDGSRRDALHARCVRAVAGLEPVVVPMLTLNAR